MPEPASTAAPAPSATAVLPLSAEDRDLIVSELRAAALAITSGAPAEAAAIVAGPKDDGRDHRTRAMHLAQRLARAAELERIAGDLEALDLAAADATD